MSVFYSTPKDFVWVTFFLPVWWTQNRFKQFCSNLLLATDLSFASEWIGSEMQDKFYKSPGQTDSQVDASFELALNLCFVWPPTCVDLCGLAMTCVDFGELKFVRKSTHVFHRLATQRKSTQVDRKSSVYAWNVPLRDLHELASRLMSPFHQ